MRIRDVEDVDVGIVDVVRHHDVRVIPGIPGERAMDLVRVGEAPV